MRGAMPAADDRALPTSAQHSLVAEVASNDGYLLQHFQAADIPVLGIEPAPASPARRAGSACAPGKRSSARTRRPALAARYGRADLIAANNVLAHVPDLPRLRRRLRRSAASRRRRHVRIPASAHLLQLCSSTRSTTSIFPTCRCWWWSMCCAMPGCACSTSNACRRMAGRCASSPATPRAIYAPQPGLAAVRAQEAAAGLHRPETYDSFAPKVARIQRRFPRLRRHATRARPPARRLWRRGQGQHVPQFLWHHRRRHRSASPTAIRRSKASCCPAATFPWSPRRRWPPRGRTTWSSCRGTSPTRWPRNSRRCAPPAHGFGSPCRKCASL